ncbi:MAG: RluA family pseudouridine synthase [Gammaproteobacteria bacterium]|nr:RluA family pseudouridine synthase [Gammaproteobacteria bacterium]
MSYAKNTQPPTSAAPIGGAAGQPVRRLRIEEEQAGQRLDRVLGGLLPGVPKSRIFRLIRRGEVRVNGRRAGPEQRLATGDELRVPPVRLAVRADDAGAGRVPGSTSGPGSAARVPAALIEAIERAIVREDERLLALDKPAGLAVHGGSGLVFGLIEALRASRPTETLELAHRLDRDTSGILLVARRPSSLRVLHALLREGAVEKRYLVLVRGRWELGHTMIDVPLRTDTRVGGERTVRAHASGKPARTEFRLIEQYGACASLLEATLHTGRTHQIRVHAAHCGHPVAGDPKYGEKAFNDALRELGLTRMFLHAHSCAFSWPGGSDVSLSAPLPAALKGVLDALASHRGRGGQGGGSRAGSGQRMPQRAQRRRQPDQR